MKPCSPSSPVLAKIIDRWGSALLTWEEREGCHVGLGVYSDFEGPACGTVASFAYGSGLQGELFFLRDLTTVGDMHRAWARAAASPGWPSATLGAFSPNLHRFLGVPDRSLLCSFSWTETSLREPDWELYSQSPFRTSGAAMVLDQTGALEQPLGVQLGTLLQYIDDLGRTLRGSEEVFSLGADFPEGPRRWPAGRKSGEIEFADRGRGVQRARIGHDQIDLEGEGGRMLSGALQGFGGGMGSSWLLGLIPTRIVGRVEGGLATDVAAHYELGLGSGAGRSCRLEWAGAAERIRVAKAWGGVCLRAWSGDDPAELPASWRTGQACILNVPPSDTVFGLLDNVNDRLDPEDAFELVEALEWEALARLWECAWFRELLLAACEARGVSGIDVLDTETELEGRRKVLSLAR